MEDIREHGSSRLVSGLENNNVELVKQILGELAQTQGPGSALAVGDRMEDIIDFLDELPRRSKVPEPNLRLFREASVSALCDLVQASEPSSLQQRSSILVPYLIDGLDYPIPRLSTSLWLMWLADRRAAEEALREHGLTSSRASVRHAAVKELGKWVDAMNGNFAFRKFTPCVVGLLRDPDATVRGVAYSLLVRFFAAAKQPARDDLANVMNHLQFNDKIKEKLLTAIANASAAESQKKELPTRELAREPAREPISRPGSSSSSRSQSSAGSSFSARAHEAAKPSPSPEPLEPVFGSDPLRHLECLKDPQYLMQPMTPLDRNVMSDHEFVAETQRLVAAFEGKESEHNWTTRQKAIHTYRKMLRSTSHEPSQSAIHEGFKQLQRPLCEVLLSMRTTLVTDACQAVKDTCQMMTGTPSYFELFDPLLDSLCKVATGIKKITAAAAHLTICAILIESPPTVSSRQMAMISAESKNLKPHARAWAFYWLKAVALTSTTSSLIPWRAEIESIIGKAVTDAAPAGRAQGRDLFWILDAILPACTANISQKLNAAAVKALQAAKPKGRGSALVVAAGPTTPAPAPATKAPLSSGHGMWKAAPADKPDSTELRKSASPPTAAKFSPAGIDLVRARTPSERQFPSRSPAPQTPSRATSRSPLSSRGDDLDASLSRSVADLSVYDPYTAEDPAGSTAAPRSAGRTALKLSARTPRKTPERTPGSTAEDTPLKVRSPLPPPRSSISSESGLGITDLADPAFIAEMSRSDVRGLLRQLSTANMPVEAMRSALAIMRKSNHEVASSTAIAKIIQTEVTNSTRAQREGYLKLLRMLDYEMEPSPPPQTQDTKATPESNRPIVAFPHKATPNGDATPLRMGRDRTRDEDEERNPDVSMRDSIYRDAGEDDSNSSMNSLTSVLSAATSVSTVSATVSPGKMASGDFIGPFATAYTECKAQISSMVNQVKQGTASVDALAGLAVLVTAASTALGPVKSPIHTAVTVWRQHFTFDMQLRDTTLPFLAQSSSQLNVDQVVVALVLLRALLSSDTPHAAVYLDSVACLKHLLLVSENFGSRSPEIDNHLLPDICRLVLRLHVDMISANAIMEPFMAPMAHDKTEPKLFSLRAVSQIVDVYTSGLDGDALSLLAEIVHLGVNDKDVRVRKEVYELLLAVCRADALSLKHATEKMTVEQRQLLNFYIEQSIA